MRVIEEFPNYLITSNGIIYRDGKEIKRQKNIDGYWVVNLYKDGVSGKSFHRRCARMVGLTYLLSSYKKGYVINHKDLDITNDDISNLEWVTPKYNSHHSLVLQPEVHRKPSEYTDDFIHEICKLIEEGVRNVDIIKKTGITKDVLHDIRSGATWKFISSQYNMTKSNKGVSSETVHWVCQKLAEGLSCNAILSEKTSNKLTIHIIKAIKSKKTWANISDLYFTKG